MTQNSTPGSTGPARSSGPALDVAAQLAALQDQLDDLVAIVARQQDTIDALERRTRPAVVVRRTAAPPDVAGRRH